MIPQPQYQHILERLIRIETRQVKIMEALQIDPYTGLSIKKEKDESRRETNRGNTLQGHDDTTVDSHGKRPNY